MLEPGKKQIGKIMAGKQGRQNVLTVRMPNTFIARWQKTKSGIIHIIVYGAQKFCNCLSTVQGVTDLSTVTKLSGCLSTDLLKSSEPARNCQGATCRSACAELSRVSYYSRLSAFVYHKSVRLLCCTTFYLVEEQKII